MSEEIKVVDEKVGLLSLRILDTEADVNRLKMHNKLFP